MSSWEEGDAAQGKLHLKMILRGAVTEADGCSTKVMLSRASPTSALARAAESVSSEQGRVGVCAQLSPTPTFTHSFPASHPVLVSGFGACPMSPRALGEGDTPAGAG